MREISDIMKTIKKTLNETYKISTTEFGGDFIEFFGKLTNDQGSIMDVEGSLEVYLTESKEYELTYSINITRLNPPKEYDGIIGIYRIKQAEECDISTALKYILCTDFVTLS
jgi:hypothetical protein